ncbi:trifunctional purine biosynthetic protein adenosine-3 [Venturia canescens]|uniref:trifunctional purine biosynthetic protein adenosine-3 n=1 Tax=Venturia canescens TaxID=32260 RepID=UPI001C9C2597|nr:trifunctional purine biosynthetic protein adenosine-3 [Venturia canescens]
MGEENVVLVIGGGGREHAICWKLAQSPKVRHVYVSPGNVGIAEVDKVSLVKFNDLKNNKEVAEWSKKEGVNLVVVGPEDYLANGIADELSRVGILCFGPGRSGAKIEADKDWAKSFMDRHGIPTAKWRAFTDASEAKKFVRNSKEFRVVKAAGLAAGKGVVVAKDADEACRAIDEILMDRKFGTAGDNLVVEELLEGEEVSVLYFTDGRTVATMPPTQDHKRALNNDLGPNTGGMGAYGPCRLLDSNDYETIVKRQVVERSIEGLKADGISYAGVLYAGLMLTKDGPKVLEFNCRFGDPETQVILPLLESDLFEVMVACCRGNLSEVPLKWRDEVFAAGVILASAGYPESSSKGQVIRGVERVTELENHIVFHSGTARDEKQGELVTNGGRVLMTVCLAPALELAAARATLAAREIVFEGKQFRTDIAHKGIARSILCTGQTSYKSSGVDIEAGDSLVSRIKPMVASTSRSGLLGGIGGFGGLFDVAAAGYKNPVLVSGTDGVGTKLKIAIECGIHDTVGIDLVAMCVNDVLAHGAEPLFFLDYFACGRLDVDVAERVVSGVVQGCKQAGCTLIGGETAEMPDMYADGEYDLAGFTVGAVERGNLLPRRDEIIPGDVVIGLPSSGVHSNGFSLVRRVLKLTGKTFNDPAPFCDGKTIGEALLAPTKIYTQGVLPAMKSNLVKAFAHVTGGGLTENIPRVLPDHTRAVIDATAWDILPVFGWLATAGGIAEPEMLRTFNCGIGAILVCSPENAKQVLTLTAIEKPLVIGRIESHEAVRGHSRVTVQNFASAIETKMRAYVPSLVESLSSRPKKVGVLISGSGTNLQALIDATRGSSRRSNAVQITLVVSNKENVEGLARAKRAGIPSVVIKHTSYPSREAFDDAVTEQLEKSGVEIVCLAGFMRILSEKFVKRWKGALLNVHPSLLPSFKGAHAHEDVLRAGVRVSGCTVHFVEVEIDSGAIIEQEAVPVLPGDTVETLQERVKQAEHRAFPRALELLATGQVKLAQDGSLQWQTPR